MLLSCGLGVQSINLMLPSYLDEVLAPDQAILPLELQAFKCTPSHLSRGVACSWRKSTRVWQVPKVLRKASCIDMQNASALCTQLTKLFSDIVHAAFTATYSEALS
jgi:hypothetical protein